MNGSTDFNIPSEIKESRPLVDGNSLQRLAFFYKRRLDRYVFACPGSGESMLDTPLDSPPFLNSDWGYGGSSAIGVPDGNTYSLMKL